MRLSTKKKQKLEAKNNAEKLPLPFRSGLYSGTYVHMGSRPFVSLYDYASKWHC
jgi:hypothetical protein